MLPEIHTALRRLLYEHGNIDPREVEVLFDAPTRERIDRLTRPAISLYLVGVQENTELRSNNMETTRGDRHAERRMPPRRIDLRYLVSAITTDTGDEHRLLWRALATLMRYQQLPSDLLPDGFAALDPPLTAKAAQPDDSFDAATIWSGLGVPPRPAFTYLLRAPLDLDHVIRAPLVLTRTVRYVRTTENGAVPSEVHQIGGTIRDGDGAPLAGVEVAVIGSAAPNAVTSPSGAFSVGGIHQGRVRLLLTRDDGGTREVEVDVPGESYDLKWK